MLKASCLVPKLILSSNKIIFFWDVNIDFIFYRHTQAYARTYSVKVATKDKAEPKQLKALYWDNLGLHKIHFYWLESYGDHVAKVDIHGNKLSNLPMNFFELLPCLEDLDISCNTIEKLPEDGIQDLKFVIFDLNATFI